MERCQLWIPKDTNTKTDKRKEKWTDRYYQKYQKWEYNNVFVT